MSDELKNALLGLLTAMLTTVTALLLRKASPGIIGEGVKRDTDKRVEKVIASDGGELLGQALRVAEGNAGLAAQLALDRERRLSSFETGLLNVEKKLDNELVLIRQEMAELRGLLKPKE